jgi:hypothetical protein
MMTRESVKKLTTTTTINPYLLAPTADTGAQVIILGHNHLTKIGHFPFVAKLTREPSSCLCIKCCLTGASLPAIPMQRILMKMMTWRSSQVLMKVVWKTKLIVNLKDHDDLA